MTKFGKVAFLAAVATLAMSPSAALAGGKQSPPKKDPCKSNPKKCEETKKGRMTGHGHFISSEHGKVQWEFRNAVCNANRFPDLKVEWGDNKFRLTGYLPDPLTCLDTPLSEGRPLAGFDTIRGSGPGTLNGEPAYATFRFSDLGEPGREDLATITIMSGGSPVLSFVNQEAGKGGNHQAHRLTGRDAR